MGTLGPGAAVDTAPAEEATNHSQQNGETLSSHAGKLAFHPICWQACVRLEIASTPALPIKTKGRWSSPPTLDSESVSLPLLLPGRGVSEGHLVAGLDPHPGIDITGIQITDRLAGFHRVGSQPAN